MDEGLRNIAVGACKHLAKQCSDSGAVSNVVKHFFKVFNGKIKISALVFGKYKV